jgi:hypothetical protein
MCTPAYCGLRVHDNRLRPNQTLVSYTLASLASLNRISSISLKLPHQPGPSSQILSAPLFSDGQSQLLIANLAFFYSTVTWSFHSPTCAPHSRLWCSLLVGNLDFFSMYYIQHCVICRPSYYIVSEDAGIEPRTVTTSALAVRRSNHKARSHPQLGEISSTTRLDVIHLPFPQLQFGSTCSSI